MCSPPPPASPLITTTTTTYIPRRIARDVRLRPPRRSPPPPPPPLTSRGNLPGTFASARRSPPPPLTSPAPVTLALTTTTTCVPRTRPGPPTSPPPPSPPQDLRAHRCRRRRCPPCPLPASCGSGKRTCKAASTRPPAAPTPRGYAYVFLTTVCLNRRRRRALKLGCTVNIRHRRAQWARSCPGQRQRWLYAYRVPHARQFEAIVQLHLKIHGAWLGRVRCDHCPKFHIEKFCWAACGGPQGLRRIIEHYLKVLNWPIIRVRIPM
ncbi:hypothetical protein C8J57DRAFT_1516781 [Mycena rebaudengoi]|nr:hypothetical protein C8J57DRAFT_1516781 [Mycena rebaudengoi]